MKRTNYIILLFLIMILYIVPKTYVVVINIIEGIGINFYSFSMYLIILMFMLFFIFFIKIIYNSNLEVKSKQLYKVAILLFVNTILISIIHVINLVRHSMIIYNKMSSEEFIAIIIKQVSNELGLIGYLTSSICFFIIIRLLKDNLDTE